MNPIDNYRVSLAKELCPICGKALDGPIIMTSQLTEEAAKEVEKFQGQVIGWAEKPCQECQSYIDKGAFFVIGIDKEKTDEQSNPYRTGHIIGIKRESEFVQNLDEKSKAKNAIYMDIKDMEKIGLIKILEEKENEKRDKN